MKQKSGKYAILILAAGTSSRLGRPKQLVKIGNGNLLSNTMDAASSIPNVDVHIILGAYSEEVSSSLETDHHVYINPTWERGMGNSIAYGTNQIKDSGYEAVILTVCDQPYLKTIHFEQLIEMYDDDPTANIIISQYETGSGPPSLFSKICFDDLCKLNGQEGAKSIIRSFNGTIKYIDFELGNIDIDTEEDLLRLP